MAKKETSSEFREIIKAIDKKEFAPFYFLEGEEDYYIDEIVTRLENKVVEPSERDFDMITFYGADADIKQVLGAAQRFPFMSPLQLVMLKEAQSMYNAKNNLDQIASYLNKPNKSTVFVITYKHEPLGASSELIKKLKQSKESVHFKSLKLKDYQLADAINNYCLSKKIAIDNKTISLLCDYIGGPINRIIGSLEKIIIAEGNDIKQITAEQIERNIGISKDFNTYELISALARKDYTRCVRIIKYFASNPKQNPSVLISATLFNFFSKLLLAAMKSDKSDRSLLDELDLKSSYGLRDYKEALRFYNSKSALAAVHFIREYDAKSKGIGSLQNEYELLRELIFNIISFR